MIDGINEIVDMCHGGKDSAICNFFLVDDFALVHSIIGIFRTNGGQIPRVLSGFRTKYSHRDDDSASVW